MFEVLADQAEGRIFDLLGWLEGRILAAKAALSN
jgi:hypothetical protein